MGCDVCISACIDDPWVDFNTFTDTATTQETCCECGQAIAPGSEFEMSKYRDSDGKEGAVSTCLECADIRKAFYCDGALYFNLWEDMRDQVFEEGFSMASECFEALKPAAKARVLVEWRKWKGLE